MRVILNSDVIYVGSLVRTLPQRLEWFARQCAAAGALLVLPETTLLEFQRAQQEHQQAAIEKVRNAFRTLRDAGIEFREVDPLDRFPLPDLPRLLRECGVQVEVMSPTETDFREAHRRASLHLAPMTPDKKSDEMRDLVIWVIACRISSLDGEAILVSRDDVHSGDLGNSEACSVNLLRVKSLEAGVEALGKQSPARTTAEALLFPSWSNLRAAGLPVRENAVLNSVRDAEFRKGPFGTDATFVFSAPTETETVLEATAELEHLDGRRLNIRLRDVRIGGQPWDRETLMVEVPLEHANDNADERLPRSRSIEEKDS